MRLPGNSVLEESIRHLLTRPAGHPPRKRVVVHYGFSCRSKSWDRPRRAVAKVAWHQGELLPRVGFVVTNLTWSSRRVVRFCNQRGRAEQLVKEGKYARHWTWLSCHGFVDNQVRLQLFVLAYNLGNSLRRLALPPGVKHLTLATLRDKLIKIGAKIVGRAQYVRFQMAEVAVPCELFAAIPPADSAIRCAAAVGAACVTIASNETLMNRLGHDAARKRAAIVVRIGTMEQPR